MACVYFLYDLKTGNPFYIGSTINEPRQRLIAHLLAAKKSKISVYQYIRANDIRFGLEVLEKINDENERIRYKYEAYWMDKFRSMGFEVQNRVQPQFYEINLNSPARTIHYENGKFYQTVIPTDDELVIVKALQSGKTLKNIAIDMKITPRNMGHIMVQIRAKYWCKRSFDLIRVFVESGYF